MTTDMDLATGYQEVVEHFAGRSGGARVSLDRWRTKGSAEKVAWVEAAETRVMYGQTPETVAEVARSTEHPLGDMQKGVVEPPTRGWTMDYAFAHALHHATETLGHVITWQEFQKFCASDPMAVKMLRKPAKDERERLVKAEGLPEPLAWQAVRWRIGINYYSYLREAYSIAVLRSEGVDAKYHVLPDALWKVDFWVDDLCIELYISNPRFKTADAGRKAKAEQTLSGGGFQFARVEMELQHEHGRVHLPTREKLLAAVGA